MNAGKMALAGLAAVLLAAGGATADVTIETVPVGNPGNADDIHGDGYGGVAYEYNIGKYEVTAGQYTEFLNAVDAAGTDPYDLYNSDMGSGYGGITFTAGDPNGTKYEVRPGRGNMPVNYVSFWDACRFANWLHNGQGAGDTETGAYTLMPDGIANNTVTRNPAWQWAVTSDDEWYKAAYYDGGSSVYYDYPTGSDTAPTAESPAGTDLVNGSANYNPAVGPLLAVGDPSAVDDLTDVGAYTTKPSDSPYGTFDQGGNVWEWNEPILGPSYRGVWGGSFGSGDFTLRAAIQLGISPTDDSSGIGFRVSEVPEPGSAALLLASVVGLLARRRRR